MNFRFVTYNILFGGKGRADALGQVLEPLEADAIVLQEAAIPEVVARLADRLRMDSFVAPGYQRRNLALLSRSPIVRRESRRAFPLHRALLEAQIEWSAGRCLSIFGVHLIAPPFHLLWELRRLLELRTILERLSPRLASPCIMAGDFNAIAPGDYVALRRMPLSLRLLFIYSQGGYIARQAIAAVRRAGLIDCYRSLHPTDPGLTLPAAAPNVRLDYIFVNSLLRPAIKACEVVTEPAIVRRASDHLPVLLDLKLSP